MIYVVTNSLCYDQPDYEGDFDLFVSFGPRRYRAAGNLSFYFLVDIYSRLRGGRLYFALSVVVCGFWLIFTVLSDNIVICADA